jgi:hypothetical protein
MRAGVGAKQPLMTVFWLGILGVTIGSGVTLVGQWIKHRWETKAARDRDEKRKALLRQMLDNPGPKGWRRMEAMSGVIGADREETARLLIEIDARSSEKAADGNDVWAYIKKKPLPSPK